MKLPNGFGSVTKLSGKRRKPWMARVTVGWEGKKQKRIVVGYYATQREALQALGEYNQNPIGINHNITLGELYNKWYNKNYVNIDDEIKEKKKKTAQMYQTAWNHLGILADMRVKDIKTSHIQDVVHKMTKKGLKYSSCHKVKTLASILMKLALADDIIGTNYASLVKLPEQEKAKGEIFSDLEIVKLWENVDKVKWVDTILIFIYTGMRISELLSLTKFNIDVKEMLITGGAKTDAGKDRIIPIHEDIQPLVLKWYNKPGEHFITKDGQKIRPDYYRKFLYYPVLEKLEIRKLTPHKARHTFSTMLHRAEVDLDTRQKLLGHADVATTLHYTHPDIEALRRGINKLKIKKHR